VNELEVFEYDVTDAGTVRYSAPSGFHDDTVDALALAAHHLPKVRGFAERQQQRDDGETSSGVSYL